MVRHSELCHDCIVKPVSYGVGICVNCYEELFVGAEPKMPNPFDDEEDFVLKHEVAQVKTGEDFKGEVYLIPSDGGEPMRITSLAKKGLEAYGNVNSIKIHSKKYKLDWSKVESFTELKLLLKAVLGDNIYVYSNSEYFDDIKHMLKDIE